MQLFKLDSILFGVFGLAGMAFALKKSINAVVIFMFLVGLVWLVRNVQAIRNAPRALHWAAALLAAQGLLTLLLGAFQGELNRPQLAENARYFACVPALYLLFLHAKKAALQGVFWCCLPVRLC
ncbi:MAG: hypothetical protein HC848_02475 [Limnobacter sp.]|nr:hypothetical protein [Limnobacter sp.]